MNVEPTCHQVKESSINSPELGSVSVVKDVDSTFEEVDSKFVETDSVFVVDSHTGDRGANVSKLNKSCWGMMMFPRAFAAEFLAT